MEFPESPPNELRPILERLTGKFDRLSVVSAAKKHQRRLQFIHGSAALEGNTLDLKAIGLWLDQKIAPALSHSPREVLEITNLHRALERVEGYAAEHLHAVKPVTIRDVHRILVSGIDDRAGILRQTPSTNPSATPPGKIPEELDELATWIRDSFFPTLRPPYPWELSEHNGWIEEPFTPCHPVFVAAEAHYRLARMQPFDEASLAVARLLGNWILVARDWPLAVIPANARDRYREAIEQTAWHRPLAFHELMAECVERSLDLYLG